MTLPFLPATAGATGALAQGFTTTDSSLSAGTLVDLQAQHASVVEKATSDHAAMLVGVAAEKPLVALGSAGQPVQVVVSGLTPALVSNINGDIKVGDRITSSPIEGVGMKAMQSTQIVGIAQSNLGDSGTTTEHVRDKNGRTTDVKVGIISLQVGITYYAVPSGNDSFVPGFLLSAGSLIAGKDVSPLRVLIGFSSLLLGFILAGIMIQTAVRSGIISIGRNPLAHKSLRRSMIDVLVTSVGVLAVTAIAFYLVLTS